MNDSNCINVHSFGMRCEPNGPLCAYFCSCCLHLFAKYNVINVYSVCLWLLGLSKCSQLCLGNGTCVCMRGYQLKSDGYTCEGKLTLLLSITHPSFLTYKSNHSSVFCSVLDYNECVTSDHSCKLGEMCINTQGSYRCLREANCGTGYELTDTNTCQG